MPSAPTLREVRCPNPACKKLLREYPARWGNVVVNELPRADDSTQRGELERCRRCGVWLEILYPVLA